MNNLLTKVQDFNSHHQIGTKVKFKLGEYKGQLQSRTTSIAFLRNGEPYIYVASYMKPVELNHIEVLEKKEVHA